MLINHRNSSRLALLLLFITGLSAPYIHGEELGEAESAGFQTIQSRMFSKYIGNGQESTVNNALSRLEATGAFSDLGYTTTGHYETHIARLVQMANAYHDDGTSMAGDADLLGHLARSLDWWLVRDYINPNWWWTYIGFPKRLAPLISTMGDVLEAQYPAVYAKLLAYYDRVFDYLLVNPRGGGANLADMSYYALLGAVSEMDVTKLDRLMKDGFGPTVQVLPSSSQADGLRVDGTIYSHGPQLYNGAYGLELLKSSLSAIELLRGTPWDLGGEAIPYVEKILIDGLAKMSYGDWLDFNAMGRGVSRSGSHRKANEFLGQIDALLALEPDNPVALRNLRDEIRYGGSREGTLLTGVDSFWYSDFLSYRRPAFYTSVRMISSRTKYNEKGNGEGFKHRYFGDGINFVLVKGNEYDSIQPLWNYERLPGLTAEQDGSVNPSINWGDWGRDSYAGSVNDGESAVAAMRLDHDRVKGWKSWFLFGDRIVALGSGIDAPMSSAPIFTTINQKMATSERMARVSELGVESQIGLNQQATLENASWVWEGDIGYVIPDGNDLVKLDLSQTSGSWRDIGTGSTSPLQGNVFTLLLDHGARPSNAGYHYTILPGTSIEETAAYAADPNVEVIANTDQLHAVHDKESGKSGVAFLADGGSVSLPDGIEIGSDRAVLLLVEHYLGVYCFTVADPQHALATVTLRVNRQLEGAGVRPVDATDSEIVISLPTGDFKGSPASHIFIDPAVPGARLSLHLGRMQSLGSNLYESAVFGKVVDLDGDWFWSHDLQRFLLPAEAMDAPAGMRWYSPQDDSWLFTDACIFPWFFDYKQRSWRTGLGSHSKADFCH